MLDPNSPDGFTFTEEDQMNLLREVMDHPYSYVNVGLLIRFGLTRNYMGHYYEPSGTISYWIQQHRFLRNLDPQTGKPLTLARLKVFWING